MRQEPESGELRELLDQYAIERLLKRYASAIDRKQYDRLDDIFSADAGKMLLRAVAGGYQSKVQLIARRIRAKQFELGQQKR